MPSGISAIGSSSRWRIRGVGANGSANTPDAGGQGPPRSPSAMDGTRASRSPSRMRCSTSSSSAPPNRSRRVCGPQRSPGWASMRSPLISRADGSASTTSSAGGTSPDPAPQGRRPAAVQALADRRVDRERRRRMSAARVLPPSTLRLVSVPITETDMPTKKSSLQDQRARRLQTRPALHQARRRRRTAPHQLRARHTPRPSQPHVQGARAGRSPRRRALGHPCTHSATRAPRCSSHRSSTEAVGRTPSRSKSGSGTTRRRTR